MDTQNNIEEIAAALARRASTNEFAKSLLDQLKRSGWLSEKQWKYARQFVAEDAAKSKTGSLAHVYKVPGIIAALEQAKSNGLKAPRLLFADIEPFGDRIEISSAKATSRNAGCAYVKIGSTYIGKILPDGTWEPSPYQRIDCSMQEALVGFLTAIDRDPAYVAQMRGRATGSCCFCGKRLTDSESVRLGYGPVCADRFGMPKARIESPREREETAASSTATEPTVDPATEPATEPAAEPAAEPATEPATEPTVEPTVEPIVEPIVEPTVEPIVEPTVEPAIETADDPMTWDRVHGFVLTPGRMRG